MNHESLVALQLGCGVVKTPLHLPSSSLQPVSSATWRRHAQSLGIYRFLKFPQRQEPSPALASFVTWDKVLLLSGS